MPTHPVRVIEPSKARQRAYAGTVERRDEQISNFIKAR
jgi:hypothetical protein